LCDDIDHSIQHAGIVISRVGRPATFREKTVETLRTQFGQLVLSAVLKERASVSESASLQKSIFQLNDRDASDEFTALSKELYRRL
jgi:chromosome partitioning protein